MKSASYVMSILNAPRQVPNKTYRLDMMMITASVTRKKSPNFYKSCLKVISQEKLKILTPLQKLPKNVEDLDKLIVVKGFKKLPKVQ